MSNVLIQGASGGVGRAFVRHLLERADVDRIIATCRDPSRAEGLLAIAGAHPDRVTVLPCDLADESSVAGLAEEVGGRADRLHLLVNASGVLHDEDGLRPERRFEDLDAVQLHKIFAINAFGPLLVVKHLHRYLEHGERAVVAHLSARVGSIADNRIGGWYGYRASKAALNQFVKTMAIELRRKSKQIICVALHPGTVDTGLSKPFQRSAKKIFTPDESVSQMMAVVEGLSPEDSGRFFAYDGSSIDW